MSTTDQQREMEGRRQRALVNLRSDESFRVFLDILAERWAGYAASALTATGPDLWRLQGRAAELKDLFRDFGEAGAAVERLQARLETLARRAAGV